MQLPLTEPTNARYTYVDPDSNQVYILMPIVSGKKICLDNTCKSASALQEFFGKTHDIHQRAVRNELMHYKNALEFDISLLDEGDIKAKKAERLWQIEQYIEAIDAILNSDALKSLSLVYPEYPPALQEIMKQPESNLHSMVLRPKEMDSWLRFVNPVFSVKRDDTGALYQTLSNAYKDVTQLPNAKTRLIERVLASPEGQQNDFAGIQRRLSEYALEQLNIEVDFSRNSNHILVTKESIDSALGCDEADPASADETINMLLEVCAPELFNTLMESPFYTRENAEELSIVTQFFLSIVNIYCYTHQISSINFGEILDNNEPFCREIAGIVLSILRDKSIENALLDYVNDKVDVFKLNRQLTPADRADIKRQFRESFGEIRKAPHFDEFILLDDRKDGPFISHQGSICLNFAEFISKALPDAVTDYLKKVCADFNTLKKEDITPTNPSVHAVIELTIDTLLEKIKDEDHLQAVLNRLPEDQKKEILASPQIKRLQVPKFLRHVARGEQDEADDLLKENPDAQFLLQVQEFTDYSGRTFHCSAFEYAYWAKDRHMCRMLMKHMDDETKTEMYGLCEDIEKQGLNYKQDGEDKNSAHFDFKPLKDALQDYVDNYDARDWEQKKTAWLEVGKAQRDVPAHVAHEYCHPDRSFDPTPAFNEASLPRDLTFFNKDWDNNEPWFPLSSEPGSRLGFDFALYRSCVRGEDGPRRTQVPSKRLCRIDLDAVSCLDEVRSAEVTRLRNDLDVAGLSENYRMSR